MHVSRLSLASCTLAMLVAATTAAAGSSTFGGKVCGLVTAKQIATIPGLSINCTNARPTQGVGATNYVANWPGKTTGLPHLQVTIAVYTDAGALQVAKRNLGQGLPGAPRKATGIGAAAYFAVGATAIGVHLNVGNDIAYLVLTTRGAPSRSTTALEVLARAVAAGL